MKIIELKKEYMILRECYKIITRVKTIKSTLVFRMKRENKREEETL